jgi:hypothetical protein
LDFINKVFIHCNVFDKYLYFIDYFFIIFLDFRMANYLYQLFMLSIHFHHH